MSHRIPYKKVLNETQFSAVTAPDGPILVIAGAGSGKTRTLVYRVAWLVEEGAPPHEILLLTFTRKAAREMLERATGLSDGRCSEVSGGTFHSLAQQVLRQEAHRIGFTSSFTIMDRSDMEEAAHALIPEVNGGKSSIRMPKSSTISTILSKAANMERGVAEIMEEEYPQFLPVMPRIERLHAIYREYKRKNNLMDYNDLIVFLRLLLRDDEEIRTKLSKRYRYIMVDEYQDTNMIQADIVRYLGSLHKNVMVVGDDSQSIYSFRGANFRNMFEFPVHFPETKIIKLEENYRSTQPILTMTNALMNQAKQKYTKCLYTKREGSEMPLAVNAGTERDQAVYVCRAIEALMDEGRKLRDIAVLFRAGYHSFELELELARRNIPFAKYGGFKFIESAHIKDLLAHLRVITNRADILSWGRLLRLLKNIGPGKSQAIIDWMKSETVPPSRVNEWPGSGKDKEGLDALAMLMSALSAPRLMPERAVELALDYYGPFLRERFDDYPRRQQELEQLITMAARYKRLRAFLDDLSLEPPASPVDVRPLDRADYLTLSTIHSAKGLEWAVVFIIWLVDGRFPPAKSFAHGESLEEELRLLYVAATRAKDKLILAYPGQEFLRYTGGLKGNYQRGPSTFLSALPPDVMEHQSFLPSFTSPNGELLGARLIDRSAGSTGGGSTGLKPGDKVNHPAFGMGVIARFEGDDKVEVIFRDKGIKLLHLGYTSLEKI
ncbi:MAG: UvrD-helicase domain-containing protein [Deltaproteobacteria bacterium]|nr:UvrD-helicase domain-containing protein [Deltaproteobacteria bacterium]